MDRLDKTYFSSNETPYLSKASLLKKAKQTISNFYSHQPKATIFAALVAVLVVISLVNQGAEFLSEDEDSQKGARKTVLGSKVSFGKSEISSLSDSSAVPSAVITIRGKNLGSPDQSKEPFIYPGRVLFSPGEEATPARTSVEALPAAWSEEEVTFFVPTNAKDGKVFVVYNNNEEDFPTNGLDFKIEKPSPKINEVSPKLGSPSDAVTIKGTGFGNQMLGNPKFGKSLPTPFPGRVMFGNIHGVISSWNNQEIVFYVPNGAMTENFWVVLDSGNGEVESSGIKFSLKQPDFTVKKLKPDAGLPTDLIVVTGEGFGNTMRSSREATVFPGKVSFGNTEGIISSWDDRNIAVFIPPGAKFGNTDLKVERFFKGKTVSSGSLTVKVEKPTPKITKVSPEGATPSNMVIIQGEGFGNEIHRTGEPTIYPGEVLFDKTPSVIAKEEWSNNRIAVFTPVGAKLGEVPITVVYSGEKSNEQKFTIKQPNPKISSINPNRILPGQPLTIKGEGFGSGISNVNFPETYPGSVWFGNQKAIPVQGTWNDKSMVVHTPFKAKSSELKVVLNAGNTDFSSNNLKYEIEKPDPKITKVELSKVGRDRILVIAGSGFNNTVNNPYVRKEFPGNVVISADGTKEKVGRNKAWLAPSSWSDKVITAPLPKNVFGTVFVELNYQDGFLYSNGFELPTN